MCEVEEFVGEPGRRAKVCCQFVDGAQRIPISRSHSTYERRKQGRALVFSSHCVL